MPQFLYLPIEIKQARETLEKSRVVKEEERMDPAKVIPADIHISHIYCSDELRSCPPNAILKRV